MSIFRFILFAGFICTCLQTMSAQKIPMHQFDVHSGVAITQAYLSSNSESVWQGADAGAGLTFGLGYSWNFARRWSLHLEANYLPLKANCKQQSFAYKLIAAGFQDTLELRTGDPTFDETYLYTPVLIQFALDTTRRFVLGAGLHFQWFLKTESSFYYDVLVYGKTDESLIPPYVEVSPPEDGGTRQYVRPEDNKPGFTLTFQYNPVIGNRQFLNFNLGLLSNFGDFLDIKSRQYYFRVGFTF